MGGTDSTLSTKSPANTETPRHSRHHTEPGRRNKHSALMAQHVTPDKQQTSVSISDDEEHSNTSQFISQYGSYFAENSVSFDHETEPTQTTHQSYSDENDRPQLRPTLSPSWSNNRSNSLRNHISIRAQYSSYSNSVSNRKAMFRPQLKNTVTSGISETPVPEDADYLFVPDKDGIVVHTLWTCGSVQRLVTALKWHFRSAARNDGHKLLLHHVTVPNYGKRLWNDYQHLVDAHLLNFEEIKEKVENACGKQCDPKTCLAHKNFEKLANTDLSSANERIFCIHFVQLVHCYIMHS